jgi:two-component system OmpR family sensor kinase
MTLRARLLTGMAAIAVVLAVAATFITQTTRNHLVAQVDAQLERADIPRGPRPGDPGERFSALYVGYFDAEDQLVTVVEPSLAGEVSHPNIPAQRAYDARDTHRAFTVGGEGGGRYRVLSLAARSGVTVVLALPLNDIDETVRRLVAVEVGATAFVLAVLGLVTWWVVRLGVQPIKRMTKTATAIAAGDLSHRVPDVAEGTEAGELGVALNQMLGRIEQAFDDRTRSEDRLKQFVADASHELRTPITTIRGYAELYRNGGLREGDELDEAIRRTEQEAVRMGGLVDDLLHLARLDQGRPLERERVDVAELARDAGRDAQVVDPDRAIEVDVTGPLPVLGDEARLRQVLANLVTNALVHTAPGTPVTVRAARLGDDAVVEVVDRGEGMPPDVAARAFERFYRADPSRSRHRGGSGLGLAIVEATVAAHGGTVNLDTAAGVGTRVRVTLPLSS